MMDISDQNCCSQPRAGQVCNASDSPCSQMYQVAQLSLALFKEQEPARVLSLSAFSWAHQLATP